MPEIKLACDCGKVLGKTQSMTAESGNRLTCCCSDCQSFALYLDGLGRGNAEPILDQFGGTDIFQMPVSKLSIETGLEQLACVRLTQKGMYRWYAKCCNTPIGNSMAANMPFIGVVHNFMQHQTSRVDEIGKNRAYVQTHEMKSKIPKVLKGSSSYAVVRSIVKILSWKLLGLNKPSVFFDKNGRTIVKPVVLHK